MNELLIIGAGGHGKVVADTANATQKWDRIAFLDDRYPAIKQLLQFPILDKFEQLEKVIQKYSSIIVAIGDNQRRLSLTNTLRNKGLSIATLIHPSAIIGSEVVIEEGSVIFANSVINASTHIGLACIINSAATVEHDCKLGAGVHISPKACLAGTVTVGDLSWVGMGANIIQNVTIGQSVIIGAGSVVINNIDDYSKVVGNPARLIETHE
ncbi:MAG: acetyltransferase [Legionellales bacterium]|nr:acetyltransferase [Legionellales bacterium]